MVKTSPFTSEAAASEAKPRKVSPKRYSIGVDLGQASDFSAIAVIKKEIVPPRTAMLAPEGESPSDRLVEGDVLYDLLYLKRPKLGTPYDRIAEAVCDLCTKLEPKGGFDEIGHLTLTIDGTGVGRGVVDMISTEFIERRKRGEYVPDIDFRPATIGVSGTQMRPPRHKRDYWYLPKTDVIFPAIVAFQQKRMRIAKDVDERDQLIHELTNYRRSVNVATGGVTMEPWREKDHDDLLFAVALALFGWQTHKKKSVTRLVR
jgi:hypothetical protein